MFIWPVTSKMGRRLALISYCQSHKRQGLDTLLCVMRFIYEIKLLVKILTLFLKDEKTPIKLNLIVLFITLKFKWEL